MIDLTEGLNSAPAHTPLAVQYLAFSKDVAGEMNRRLALPSAVSTGRITPSVEQSAIWDWMSTWKDGGGWGARKPNLMVEAVAGSGKTFTSLEGGRLIGEVTASTLHSAAFKAVKERFGNVRVDEHRLWKVMDRVFGGVAKDGKERGYRAAVKKVVGLAKAHGVDGDDRAQLSRLVDGNAIDLAPAWLTADQAMEFEERVYKGVEQVMVGCVERVREEGVDFDDMIWLPYALDLPIPMAAVGVIDEAQDLNRVQQWYAPRIAHKVMVVGDRRQAIYGWRGADASSMDTLSRMLNTEELRLTVTRRCGQKIVELAQRVVPHIRAAEGAVEGVVRTTGMGGKEGFVQGVGVGAMVVCRVNAPLISNAYALLKAGTPAVIKGKDIHGGVERLMQEGAKRGGAGVAGMLKGAGELTDEKLDRYLAMGEAGMSRASTASDQLQCLQAVVEGCGSMGEVAEKLTKLFASTDPSQCVTFSSVHKAKGLEADSVWVLNPELLPHPMAKTQAQKVQEQNLWYVAVTRAAKELVWVEGGGR